MVNLNVLSQRYAGPEINTIFSEQGRNLAERELWLAVLKAQKELGLDIPEDAIAKYEAAKEKIDLEEIKRLEMVTKHDVKAKIQAFVKVAGAEEHIHKGLTSRDLTDNVEQMQFRKAAQVIFGKYAAVLRHFCDRAKVYENIILTARTHHQPAQPTLLGRRFAMWTEELYTHLKAFETFLDEYPLRGIKGPVGTQFDMLTLLGSVEKVKKLEQKVAASLGFKKVLEAPGQVYPRSLDYALVSQLALLGSACENFAKAMRLMAGYELVTEGFKEGQVGSSSMPHKMNTRSSERICGLAELLKMYADGASRLSGDQWEEGDVSCSVMRRIIVPDALYASDGLCETTLTVLNNMGVYPHMIHKELERYLPFLTTTEILMMAIQAGIGREQGHSIIKKYAVAEALQMRSEGHAPALAEKLAQDPVFKKAGITAERIQAVLKEQTHFLGNAREQIQSVTAKAGDLLRKYPQAAQYEPGEIL